MKTKQELLDQLEQETLIIAGDVKLQQMRAVPRFNFIDDHLGEMIKAILELKKIEGFPSNLKLVE